MDKLFPDIKEELLQEDISSPYRPDEIYALFSGEMDTAILDSSLTSDAGRFSFIGLHPFAKITGRKDRTVLSTKSETRNIGEPPLEVLDHLISSTRVINTTDSPLAAGCMGFFSYGLKNSIELLPSNAMDDTSIPDIYFVFYRVILTFDATRPGRIRISVLDMKDNGRLDPAELLEDTKLKIMAYRGGRISLRGFSRGKIASNFAKQDYIASINKALEHIRAGDIYQVCLAQRFSSSFSGEPYDLFLRLNRDNPSPFAAYLNFDRIKVVSSSPELFLRVRGRSIETRPMKGTRPIGGTEEETRRMIRELTENEKEKAELSMIVDLERNDLGKVSEHGSVILKEHRRIETYPTVIQSISIVQGTLRTGTSTSDIIKACFPGGSISGCPKIRALQMIDELEPHARGVYTGAIGYLSFHDTLDLNIAIRTITIRNGYAYFHAGGGIVVDSDPEKEFEETLIKAKALINAVRPVND
ncbi:MAG: aminodeoxychorismate synthase component I [Candidatus Omnitrophica bacterium]|nr:aminodeoxychorismate synthase component I [Candidatus Omnitrophota bacterium]MDD5487671.1 aminodeoxychorismate synthase component I [Candidatus Omnitrophota bacterium]